MASVEAASPDIKVTAVLNCTQEGSIGLLVRYASANDFILGLYSTSAEGGGASLTIYKRVAGVFTTLASMDFTDTGGSDRTLFLSADASDLITFDYAAGTHVLSATDPAGSSNTKVGIYSRTMASSKVDDFTVVSITVVTGRAELFSHSRLATSARVLLDLSEFPILDLELRLSRLLGLSGPV